MNLPGQRVEPVCARSEAAARAGRGPLFRISRRSALVAGAAGVAGLAGMASVLDLFSKWREAEAPADIFKGDAPNAEVWALWQRRGWVKEASHYLKLGRNVQCKICPNNCLLSPGDRSHCRNKVNVAGTLYTMVYGNPCTFHVDPVEKKPLFHFLPGTRTFSLATSGCVFRCLNCQNWEISQKKPEETKDPRGAELRLRPPLPEALSLGPDGTVEPLSGRRRFRGGPRSVAPRSPTPTRSLLRFTNTPPTPARPRVSAGCATSS